MLPKIISFAIILSGVVFVALGYLSSDIKPCKPNDEQCMVDMFNYIIATRYMGDPSMNLDCFDPLRVNKLESVHQTKSSGSPINLQYKFQNCNVFGYRNLRAHKCVGFGENPEGVHEIHFKAPLLYMLGDYTCNGNLNIMPVQGVGQTNVSAENVEITYKLIAGSKVIDGLTYMDVKELNMEIDAERVHFDYKNLYNGDELLSDALSKEMDSNWRDIFEDVKRSSMGSYAKIHEDIARKVFGSFPYNDFVKP